MKQHKPLKPLKVGDRVRVYCAARQLNGAKGTIYCACQSGAAWGVKLDRPTDLAEIPDCYDHQLRRLLPRKAKQETERVELWVSRKDYAGIPPLNSARLVVSRAALVPDRYARLLEVRPGERVLSREDLAKAWDKTMGERGGWPMSSDSASFAELCTALGLGLSKEGGK